jgi:hypothetical protein
VFDSIGDPNAKGSPTTARSLISGGSAITAEDSSSPNRFAQLMLLIVTTQEAMLYEGSYNFAMRTGSSFQLGQQIVDILLGRKDPAHN